jgi:hypothetical protein
LVKGDVILGLVPEKYNCFTDRPSLSIAFKTWFLFGKKDELNKILGPFCHTVVPSETVFFQQPLKSLDTLSSLKLKLIGRSSRIEQNFIRFVLALVMGDVFCWAT